MPMQDEFPKWKWLFMNIEPRDLHKPVPLNFRCWRERVPWGKSAFVNQHRQVVPQAHWKSGPKHDNWVHGQSPVVIFQRCDKFRYPKSFRCHQALCNVKRPTRVCQPLSSSWQVCYQKDIIKCLQLVEFEAHNWPKSILLDSDSLYNKLHFDLSFHHTTSLVSYIVSLLYVVISIAFASYFTTLEQLPGEFAGALTNPLCQEMERWKGSVHVRVR